MVKAATGESQVESRLGDSLVDYGERHSGCTLREGRVVVSETDGHLNRLIPVVNEMVLPFTRLRDRGADTRHGLAKSIVRIQTDANRQPLGEQTQCGSQFVVTSAGKFESAYELALSGEPHHKRQPA